MTALLVTFVIFQTISRCLGEPFEFPEGFLFGAGTAAFAAEGGWNADGKGESYWDFIAQNRPELIETNPGGNVTAQAEIAADSYHKFDEDIRVAKEIGLDYYRFSISWTRLFPKGFTNVVNPAGLAYYNKLIDAVIAADIIPVVVLHHYDSPATADVFFGGFSNELGILGFTAYADQVFGYFSDRVDHWVTFNAPYEYCKKLFGDTIAGEFKSFPTGHYEYHCGHNVLRAHAKVYRLYKSKYDKSQKGTITMSFSLDWYEPATTSLEDIEASRRAMDFQIGWFLHPIIYGDYPPSMRNTIAKLSEKQNFTFSRLPQFTPDEKKEIRNTADYLPLTFTATYLVTNNEEVAMPPNTDNDVQITRTIKDEWRSENSFETKTPWGFRKAIKYVWETYGQPIISISQLGYGAYKDSLNDTYRVDFLKEYLNQVLQLIYEDHVHIKYLSIWSLIDLFYFQYGHKITYGLAQVDFEDPARTRVLRASADYYKKVIKTRRV